MYVLRTRSPLPSLLFFSRVGCLLPPTPPHGSNIWSRRELNGGSQQAAVEQQDPCRWGAGDDTGRAELPAARLLDGSGGPRSRPNKRQEHGGGDFFPLFFCSESEISSSGAGEVVVEKGGGVEGGGR